MSAAAVLGTQQNSDQSVIQQAARPKKRCCLKDATSVYVKVLNSLLLFMLRQEKHVVHDPKTSVPVILAVASAVGVLLWWKAHKKSSKKGGTGDSSSSSFAFPGSKVCITACY